MVYVKGHEVLFEGDGDSKGWSILKDRHPLDSTYTISASHVTCEGTTDEALVAADEYIISWFRNEDAFCYYCNATVPAVIQALIHLQSSF